MPRTRPSTGEEKEGSVTAVHRTNKILIIVALILGALLFGIFVYAIMFFIARRKKRSVKRRRVSLALTRIAVL